MMFPRSPLRSVLCACLSAAGLWALAGCQPKAPAAAPPPVTQVGTHTVTAERALLTTELPGRTSARLVAEVRPQVSGVVQSRLFEEGAMVKAGQVLYQIDPASYQASVNSAQASVARSEATVNAARLTAQRNAELVKGNAVSQQVNDDSQAVLQQAQAELLVARAALDNARINLERTRISAPISGRIDLSAVTPGALVVANQDKALTTVQQLDPMVVDVVQPSSEVLRLRRELAAGTLQGKPGGEVSVRVLLEDGTVHAHPGRLSFNGVSVNRSTDAITLRALVPNPQGVLMPGMYVRAQLDTGVVDNAMLVPQQGVSRTPTGEATALVVGADGKAEKRVLKVDRAVGNRWQVSKGLKVGDRVIVEGLQQLRPGALVKATPAASASANSAIPAASAAR